MRNLRDVNTKNNLKVILFVSGISVGLGVLLGGSPSFLMLLLFGYSIYGFDSVNKLMQVEEYRNSLKVVDYKIKKKHWIIFGLVSLALLIISFYLQWSYYVQ